MTPLLFSLQMTSEKRAQYFHTDDVSLPRSASDWSCHVGNLLSPMRSSTQIWVVTHHQYMEFLRSFLRRHFVGKPVVASQNVSCFLRLQNSPSFTPFTKLAPPLNLAISSVLPNFLKIVQM